MKLLKKELIKTAVIAKLYIDRHVYKKFLSSVNFGVINIKSTNCINVVAMAKCECYCWLLSWILQCSTTRAVEQARLPIILL